MVIPSGKDNCYWYALHGKHSRVKNDYAYTEVTGTLRIYRAPESVAFVNCQKALKPILPRSQCWFVSDDGSSKFVMQVRKLQEYWRIEMRNTSSEEINQVEGFKKILAQVLLYEKTPCPFQRTFSVDLPIALRVPFTRIPWRPVQRSSSRIPLPRGDLYPIATKPTLLTSSSPKLLCTKTRSSSPLQTAALHQPASSPTEASCRADQDQLSQEVTPEASSAKPMSLTLQTPTYLLQTPTYLTQADLTEPSSIAVAASSSEPLIPAVSHAELDEDNNSDGTDDTNTTPTNPLPSVPQSPLGSKIRPQALHHCSRSITAPPVLSLVTSPPSKRRNRPSVMQTLVGQPDSELSSSVESFYSIQSWHSPLDVPLSPPLSGPPSPITFPYTHENIVLPKRAHSKQAISQLNVTSEIDGTWHTLPIINGSPRILSPAPRTPTLINDGELSEGDASEANTPSPPRPRHRGTTSTNSQRRALSPLPAAVNIFSPPPRSRRLQTARHLPTAIIQKTCEILLSPPSHLLHMMINIASKIAAGEWRGMLPGEGEAVHWDFAEDDYHGDTWTVDDFGFSLTPTPSRRRGITPQAKCSTTPSESWEVD